MKRTRNRNFLTIVLWGLVLVYLFPLYMAVTIAVKSPEEFVNNTYGLPKMPQLGNLIKAAQDMQYFESLKNGLIILAGTLLILVAVSSIAAYALARGTGKVYGRMYTFFLAGMMVPIQLIMIPLYKIINSLQLMNTYQGVILIYTAINIPLAIVILRGFISTIPKELDEAAKIDGAGLFTVYWRVILPLIKAPLTTVVIFVSVTVWNDLLTPLLFLGGDKKTLIIALYNFKGASYTTDWTMIFAGSVLTMIPLVVVFLCTQKYFIKGMIAGAVKG